MVTKTQSLKKKLDKLFSEYVRKNHADKNGMVKCCTCGKLDYWKDCDAGHYVSRSVLQTRYDERNVYPQCRSCNRFNEGKKDEYTLFLIRKHGQSILEELNKDKWKPIYSFPFEEKIQEYKDKLKQLKEL